MTELNKDVERLDLVEHFEPLIAGLFALRGDILSAEDQRTAATTIVRCLPDSIKNARAERDSLLSKVGAMRETLERIERITRAPENGVDEADTMDDHRRDLFHAWHAASTALSTLPTKSEGEGS